MIKINKEIKNDTRKRYKVITYSKMSVITLYLSI